MGFFGINFGDFLQSANGKPKLAKMSPKGIQNEPMLEVFFMFFGVLYAKRKSVPRPVRIGSKTCPQRGFQGSFWEVVFGVVFTGLTGFDGIDGVHIWDLTGYQRDAAQDSVHVFCYSHRCSSASPHYMLNI